MSLFRLPFRAGRSDEPDDIPRIPASRDDSKLRGLTGSMSAKGALCQRVELPGLDVGLELPVPGRGVEFREPLAETGELFWREFLDLPFDGFYGAHGAQYSN